MFTVLIVAGVLVVVVLIYTAVYYLRKVNAMELKKSAELEALDKLKREHNAYLNSSVQVLAQGLREEQLSLTEGAIRISVLLDNLKISEVEKSEYSAIFQLAEATSHIPILEGWKNLSKQEKSQFEKVRLDLEAHYKDFVLDAARRLKGKAFA